MSDITDKAASTYEQTQDFIQTAQEKMDKASSIAEDVIKTANQAREDVQNAEELLDGLHQDVMELVSEIGDLVDSIGDGDIPGIVQTIKKGVELFAVAIPKYTEAYGDVQTRADAYGDAVKRNKEALQSFL
jgi:chromosome segregation ATPase